MIAIPTATAAFADETEQLRKDLDAMNEITRILDENLRQGALGVGVTVGYASRGISTYEQLRELGVKPYVVVSAALRHKIDQPV